METWLARSYKNITKCFRLVRPHPRLNSFCEETVQVRCVEINALASETDPVFQAIVRSQVNSDSVRW
jgi:hypothetical protein